MSLPASWRALGRVAGWAVPILAGLLLAPSGARASCGDYVVTRLSGAGLAPAGEHAAPAGELPSAAPRPPKRCPGPYCSQVPAAPPAPMPTAPPQTALEWGCVTDGLLVAAPGRSAGLAEQTACRPVRLPSAIFHPPRPSA